MEILQHHYGGMAFRGIDDWFSENVLLDILTNEGKTRADGNGTESRWVDPCHHNIPDRWVINGVEL